MNALFVAVFATLAAIVSASVVGHGSGVIVAGPSGIVTPHGAIGPAGHGLGLGLGLGHGAVVSGPSGIVTPHGAIGPAGHGLGLGHGAVVAGPAVGLGYGGLGLGNGLGLGHGLGLGYGGLGVGHGLGLAHGGIALGGHGVAVRGPATVPAVIAGPSGKIVADGLYGVPHHGYGHHW